MTNQPSKRAGGGVKGLDYLRRKLFRQVHDHNPKQLSDQTGHRGQLKTPDCAVMFLKCDQRYDTVDSDKLGYILSKAGVTTNEEEDCYLEENDLPPTHTSRCSCQFCEALQRQPRVTGASRYNSQQPSCVGLSTLLKAQDVERQANQILEHELDDSGARRGFPAANYMSRYLEAMIRQMSPSGSIDNGTNSPTIYDLLSCDGEEDDNFTSISCLDPNKPIRFPRFSPHSPAQNGFKSIVRLVVEEEDDSRERNEPISYHPNSPISTGSQQGTERVEFDAPINEESYVFQSIQAPGTLRSYLAC